MFATRSFLRQFGARVGQLGPHSVQRLSILFPARLQCLVFGGREPQCVQFLPLVLCLISHTRELALLASVALEKAKARIRARVEHPFRVIKRQFGYAKVRFRGMAKNTVQVLTLFALSNLWMARKQLLGSTGKLRPKYV